MTFIIAKCFSFSATIRRQISTSGASAIAVPVGLLGEHRAIRRAEGSTAAICAGVGWNPCSRFTSSGTARAPAR